ncbi:Hypothetical predicted protein [Mytilus galloprovincialis]|uniref:Uncharacterized protein n=1 Tax=Mytilus galloprovincialis TaxID=29158 RepID=A0A8B6DI97_MYTGA|nr:Hypothetical predicted protein [Mytilus galloprovincialis]
MNLKSADVLQPKAMFNNKPIISPDEIRKMLDRMNDKVKQIHKLGQQVLNGSSTSKPTTQPAKETTTQPAKETTTKLIQSSTGSNILNGTITNNATNGIDDQNIDNTKASNETLTTTLAVSTKTKQTESSKWAPNDTTEPTVTTNTTVTTIIPKGSSFESNAVKTNESLNTDDSDSDTTTLETILSDDEIKKAQNAATNDNDFSIFRTSEAERKQRKKEIKLFCARIDFGTAKKGFQCCKKTLNCFDDLPDDLDETVFHNGQRHYNEAERLHVCHHIDEALICQGDVFRRTVCQDVNPIMEGKIKPQLDKVKLFYYNHCNRGTAITPTGGNPSQKPHPHPHVPPTVPGGTGTGSEQYHSHTNSYAPYIGGAIMGVFALVIIVLFAIYCRKRVNKRKRNKEQRNDPGRESTQSSRYKTVSYNRRKSDVYAEIDEKSMISSVSYNIDGHSCSTDVTNLSNHSNTSSFSRKYQSAPSIRQLELDNHGYLSPESILPADELKPNIEDENTSTHGYIELNSELGDSGQSYAKLEPEPEDEYIQADEIESTPNKKKKPDEQGHMYFVLEKENEEYDKVLDQ